MSYSPKKSLKNQTKEKQQSLFIAEKLLLDSIREENERKKELINKDKNNLSLSIFQSNNNQTLFEKVLNQVKEKNMKKRRKSEFVFDIVLAIISIEELEEIVKAYFNKSFILQICPSFIPISKF